MTTNTITDEWAAALADWRTAMQAMRLSTQTMDLRIYHVRRVARAQLASSPWAIDRTALLEWVGGHEWSRETARAVRSSIRRFWAWGIATGRTADNTADILPMVKPELPRPRPADRTVVTTALGEACPRVALMLRLANELGMRRGEVAQVHPENDLVRDLAGWSLVVHGKGQRQRVLPLPDSLATLLRNANPGYLFPNPAGGHLSAHWVGTLVSRALANGTTMHQLRHLCATEIHDETHDVRLVQTILGHASLATTQRYLAVDESKVRDAVIRRAETWSQRSDS